MAGFISDSDEDKAVEELLSQAMDSTVLDQVAAINCAGFEDSGGLPSHLETRFARLKSFPSAAAKPKPKPEPSTTSFSVSPPDGVKKFDPARNSGDWVEGFSPQLPQTKGPESKNCSSPGDSVGVKKNASIGIGENGRKSHSTDSWEGFSSRSRSVSPPAKSGCFLCSPKKVSRKLKKKESRGLDSGLDWGKHDKELLTDLSNFSVHSQKNMMRKAMEEEEKICREAEKIVKWAKQASARIDVSDIEDVLSDGENHKFS